VYGTLRDDDDSGALWTRSFLDGVAEASDGLVEGAEMFWSSEGLWPFVLLHPLSPALSEQIDHTLQTANTIVAANPAAAIGDSTSTVSVAPAAVTVSPPALAAPSSLAAAPSCSIRVRLLRWPDAASFAEKLARADEIEGYDPSNEASSEYVRRKVWVTRLLPPPKQSSPTPFAAACGAAVAAAAAATCSSMERVLAWIYVKQAGVGETTSNATSSARIEHGDWMKRDRTRQHPATAGASP
jgi:hypothetical protein